MKEIAGEIDRLQNIVDENPRSLLFARLAEYYLQLNRIPEAIEICKKGLEHHPNYANAHFVLGQCYFETQDYDAAETELNKVLLHDSEHVRALHFQAKIMKERGWNNAYVLSLNQIVTIDPNDRLAQSLIEDYSKEDFATEEQTFDVETDIIEELDDVETKAEVQGVEESFSEEWIEEETSDEVDVLEEIEDTDVTEEEEIPAETQDDKRYEFILDDIFKDEVSQEEPIETLEKEIESYEEAEGIWEKSDEDVGEEIIEEDEIASQVREKVEQVGEDEVEMEIEEIVEEASKEKSMQDEDLVEEVIEEIEPELEKQDSIFTEDKINTFEEIIEEEITEHAFEPDEIEEQVESEIEEKDILDELLKEDEIKKEKTKDLIEEEIVSEDSVETIKMEEDVDHIEMEIPPVIDEPKQEEKVELEKTPSKPKEPIVTSTLGEIYAAQGHYAKAISVYEILLKKNPDKEFYKQKIEELNRKLEEEIDKE